MLFSDLGMNDFLVFSKTLHPVLRTEREIMASKEIHGEEKEMHVNYIKVLKTP